MLIQENLGIREKLAILSDAAKYDVACTSSGVSRKGQKGTIGSTSEAGICHSFAADGRCISLLKILFTNQCIYDCKYCINRSSNDVVRTAFTPEEVCTLTMEFYRRNYIEGLFLSSGILYNADYTMEQIYQTVLQLRTIHHFLGYIHVKAIPGADPVLVEKVGFLADRMSINLELPTAEGLKKLAPGKTRDKILKPMRQIQLGIHSQQQERIGQRGSQRSVIDQMSTSSFQVGSMQNSSRFIQGMSTQDVHTDVAAYYKNKPSFVPAGQSTQMIVGATPENDYQMVTVAEALYKSYDLKRVFYSAYVSVNQDSSLPVLPGGPPLLREHRLYQADWLMRFYGFSAGELLSEKKPNFNVFLDPKCDWAIQHLEQFPVEINRADYGTLLRVPGIGVKSARRIVAARRGVCLDFPDLKKLGVVLKRAVYFITCGGKMMYATKIDQDYITSQIVGVEKQRVWDIEHKDMYRQLSLFDDGGLMVQPTVEDHRAALFGNL